MGRKRYGSAPAQVKPFEFEFVLYRDTNAQGEAIGRPEGVAEPEDVEPRDDLRPELHEFTAMPRIDAGQLIRLLASVEREDTGVMLDALSRQIRKVLSDKDGTPVGWAPQPMPKVDGEPLRFRGPDGELYSFTDQAVIEKFTAFGSGSSRRRWSHLLLDDDHVSVEIDDLATLAQDLIGASANRPT